MKERNSNIELLRIILMMMIIGLHIFLHGGVFKNVEAFSFNYYATAFLECFFVVAVNCFILISGYFLIKNPVKKVLKLELQLIFYSFFITLLFYIFNFNDIKVSLEELISSLFPVLTNMWWFVSFYVILMLLSPFINKLVEVLTKDQFKKLLLILFIFFSLLPTLFGVINLSKILPHTPLSLIDNRNGHSFNNFVFMYFIGAYIGKFKEDLVKGKAFKYLFFYLCLVLLNFGYGTITDIITTKKYYLYTAYDNILVVFASVALFLFFANLNFKVGIINRVGKLAFAVYLIHEHPLIRRILYVNTKAIDYSNGNYYVQYVFILIISVFIICALVEFIRQFIFNKLEDSVINRIIK